MKKSGLSPDFSLPRYDHMIRFSHMKKADVFEMNESHDWLGEAAEHYVRYILAREGFLVFAGSKWDADCAFYRKDNPSRWWKIEVRSTDTRRWPKIKKYVRADFVVDVRFERGERFHSAQVFLSVVHKDGRYRHGEFEILPVRKNNTVQFQIVGRSIKCEPSRLQSFILEYEH